MGLHIHWKWTWWPTSVLSRAQKRYYKYHKPPQYFVKAMDIGKKYVVMPCYLDLHTMVVKFMHLSYYSSVLPWLAYYSATVLCQKYALTMLLFFSLLFYWCKCYYHPISLLYQVNATLHTRPGAYIMKPV